MSLNEEKILLMIIKPSGLEYVVSILERIKSFGFKIIDMYEKQLTLGDIEFLYGEIFSNIRSIYDSSKAQEYIKNHYKYMRSSPVILIAAFYSGDEDPFEVALKLKGSAPFGNQCQPGTIRYDFGRNMPFNSFHTSSSYNEAKKEIERFFPHLSNKL
jgi:nucleoside diphosphate kinase